MRALELFVGMDVWCKGSSLTYVQDEILVPAANGLVTNVTDPDGETIETESWGFRALGPVTSGTWVPCRFVGRIVYDDT